MNTDPKYLFKEDHGSVSAFITYKYKMFGLTSSGRLSMIFDMSMYLRASRALLSSTLSYCSKAWKKKNSGTV
jgi:hypothetical protein